MFYKGKKCLVLGGTGFVGTHFVRQLLDQGANVRIPVHIRPPRIDHPNLELIPADLTLLEDCLRVMEDVDYAFHCAGAVSAAAVTVGNNPLAPIATNLILTLRIMEAAWSVGIDRILIFGSSTAYPATEHSVREDEMWSAEPHPAYFGYGWSRRYTERLVEFAHDRSPVKVALVRPTATYGPEDDFDPRTSHVIPALIRRAMEREDPFVVWGTGEEIRDTLYIDDLVRGSLLALEKLPACEAVNIGYGKGHTVRELVEVILKSTNYEEASVVYDSTKPSTIPVRLTDTTKAKNLLGFEPVVTLEEGVQATVDWYRQKFGIKN